MSRVVYVSFLRGFILILAMAMAPAAIRITPRMIIAIEIRKPGSNTSSAWSMLPPVSSRIMSRVPMVIARMVATRRLPTEITVRKQILKDNVLGKKSRGLGISVQIMW